MTQLGIGIDYGTSNSAAAWFDGENIHLVRVRNRFDRDANSMSSGP